MADQSLPAAPEDYPADVREALDQEEMTHEGRARGPGDSRLEDHLGAVDDEPTPIVPPMEGPSNLTEGSEEDFGIDPYDEIAGG